MISGDIPEPASDLAAQLRFVSDPEHPKRAVFIHKASCPGNYDTPQRCFRGSREVGDLISSDMAAVERFLSDNLDERVIAEILGYPQAKPDLRLDELFGVVQVITAHDEVIQEAGATGPDLEKTIAEFSKYIPIGGSIRVVPIEFALARRQALTRGCNGLV